MNLSYHQGRKGPSPSNMIPEPELLFVCLWGIYGSLYANIPKCTVAVLACGTRALSPSRNIPRLFLVVPRDCLMRNPELSSHVLVLEAHPRGRISPGLSVSQLRLCWNKDRVTMQQLPGELVSL